MKSVEIWVSSWKRNFSPILCNGTEYLKLITNQLHSRILLEKLTNSQLLKNILWNPKVHYHFNKCLPPVPTLSQIDAVHTPTSHVLTIRLNIILPSMPGSSKWSLSLRFPHQKAVYAFPLPHTCYMPRPFLAI